MLELKEELNSSFGYLFEDELIEEIDRIGTYKTVEEGEILMDFGEVIAFMPLLLKGAIKIMREDDEGDEMLLYFIEQGDTCAMTITCCMGQTKSEIRAIAESESALIMVPVQKMKEWLAKYPSWQSFILQSYHERMTELLEAIDALAFMRLDERLLKYLQDKAMVNRDDMIQSTHQEIALDLHSSRVVVSRLLKRLEKVGKIKLYRNKIKVIDL
ncbi:MAG: Crp/Fnr family transcriptional regulator [Bacteroidia bacterium]|nr:Crp/Fnr family transcriptional regulator [Bacteroidia bacterium]NND24743.1 Crp/Fnr family transcriptional regulator [Flavobacteriaceae bacterium]MBT8277838.1 Crp/Fnr family transcriptional regulator [Bacteroidia bacterium]NNK59078.1 Crp/Fnr family transcriptional regulator [Flavobacteriaceae bacterium]NNL31863.1 Crp/Fnr family transcriptional regulator [Flavobacteriaceae bacterium]